MVPATRGETSHMLLALPSTALELTFHVVQRASGKEGLALPFRNIKDSHKCETVELDGDFSVATLEARPDIAEHQPWAPFKRSRAIRVVCWEGKLDHLLADLAIHKLDLVISDTPAPPSIKVQAHSHLMGASGVTLFAAAKLKARYRQKFPRSLEGAPFLLPTSNAMLRRGLEDWFVKKSLHPAIIGEFEDSATLKAFGHEGYGIFPGPTVLEKEIRRQYQVEVLGRIDTVTQQFFAVTVDSRLKHPIVMAIPESARRDLFG